MFRLVNSTFRRLFPEGACEFLLICVAILVASTCGLEGFKGAKQGIRDQSGRRDVWWFLIGKSSQGKSTF